MSLPLSFIKKKDVTDLCAIPTELKHSGFCLYCYSWPSSGELPFAAHSVTVYCLSTDPKSTGPINHRLDSPKLYAKGNFFTSWCSKVFVIVTEPESWLTVVPPVSLSRLSWTSVSQTFALLMSFQHFHKLHSIVCFFCYVLPESLPSCLLVLSSLCAIRL